MTMAIPKWVWIIGALLYIVLPIDLIPDVIPLLGFIDDLLIFVFAIWKGGN